MKKFSYALYHQVLDFDYTQEEIETRILDTLSNGLLRSGWGICSDIVNNALDEFRIIGQQKDCFYSSDWTISSSAHEKICKAIHKLVKEEKILYCFDDNFKIWK